MGTLPVKCFLIGNCNLGQKVGEKLTKLSKIGFSMECFAVDILQIFTKKRQNLAFELVAGYSLSTPRSLRILKILSLESFGNS